MLPGPRCSIKVFSSRLKLTWRLLQVVRAYFFLSANLDDGCGFLCIDSPDGAYVNWSMEVLYPPNVEVVNYYNF